jgi:2,4-dienoyl-CoA reductase-like NADH-dependent reductase (Old Yellow Enzyme family)
VRSMASTPAAQLFEPLQLRSLRLRNRSVVSPMCQYTAEHGMVGDKNHTVPASQLTRLVCELARR